MSGNRARVSSDPAVVPGTAKEPVSRPQGMQRYGKFSIRQNFRAKKFDPVAGTTLKTVSKGPWKDPQGNAFPVCGCKGTTFFPFRKG